MSDKKINIGTIGHVDHGKLVLPSLIAMALSTGMDVHELTDGIIKPITRKEFTIHDQQRIDAAEVKRQKKRDKRLKRGGRL